MSGEILKAVLEQALTLTAPLPESIQGVAFAKAFDALLAEHTLAEQQRKSTARGYSPTAPRAGRSRVAASRHRRVGPKSALAQLVDSGYFASSRSLPEIQAHLRDSYGHEYGSNELSISLLRLIRDGRLTRERNLAGQYEYWAEDHREQPAGVETLKQTKPHARLLTDGRSR